MKVKIGTKIYNGEKEMITVILNKYDKENIKNMAAKATKYCEYPDNTPRKDVLKFMGCL